MTVGTVRPFMDATRPPLRPLGDVLRELRRERGLSQEAAAELVSVSQSVLSNREVGTSRVQIEDVLRFEDALGLCRGEVYRRAGYVVDPTGPMEQIDSWTFLDADWRAGLKRMVEEGLRLAAERGRAVPER